MCADASLRSRTCRAIGPWTASSWKANGALWPPPDGTRPRDGFSAMTPQQAAGQRSDPAPSLPIPSGTMPDATAAASPPLEPPGVCRADHGLRVAPRSALAVCQRIPNSGMLVRPAGIMPAARSSPICGASRRATASRSATMPSVVADPATSMFSLTVIGTPDSGPGSSPHRSAASAASAASSACPSSVTVTAFTTGFTCPIRSRCACTTARTETSRARTSRTRSHAASPHSSVVTFPPLADSSKSMAGNPEETVLSFKTPSAARIPAENASGRLTEIRERIGDYPEVGRRPPADDEAMETNSIPPQDTDDDGATTGNRTGKRTLRRPAQDRIFAGVGVGVADYLGTDVTATRVGLAATAVLAHVAIPAYAIGWALIPEEGKSRSRAAEFLDSLTTRVRQV